MKKEDKEKLAYEIRTRRLEAIHNRITVLFEKWVWGFIILSIYFIFNAAGYMEKLEIDAASRIIFTVIVIIALLIILFCRAQNSLHRLKKHENSFENLVRELLGKKEIKTPKQKGICIFIKDNLRNILLIITILILIYTYFSWNEMINSIYHNCQIK